MEEQVVAGLECHLNATTLLRQAVSYLLVATPCFKSFHTARVFELVSGDIWILGSEKYLKFWIDDRTAAT